MYKDSKVFVAGHNGLVGSAIIRKLQNEGFEKIVTRRRDELDLTNQADVEGFFAAEKPEYVFLAAAKVGGILANSTFPADFIRENLSIQTNVIDSAYRQGTKKLLFLGSSCIYPKLAPQPLREEYLLSSELEATNEAYAIAKIAGLMMCQAYNRQFGFDVVCVMPTNLYGPKDNFDLKNSHVLPALIRKFHEAKSSGAESVKVWGSGKPKREFLYVDDLAEGCFFLMNQTQEKIDSIAKDKLINVGVGKDISIYELAMLIREVVGFEGEIEFDSTKPDGTPRKLLDVSRMNKLGWKANVLLRCGIEKTYEWFKNNNI